MSLNDILFFLMDLLLLGERLCECLLQIGSRLANFLICKFVQWHFFVYLFKADSLPEGFFLELIDNRLSKAWIGVILREMIDILQADAPRFIFRSLYLLSFGHIYMLLCVLTDFQLFMHCAPIDSTFPSALLLLLFLNESVADN